jgi:hypothetical protein
MQIIGSLYPLLAGPKILSATVFCFPKQSLTTKEARTHFTLEQTDVL